MARNRPVNTPVALWWETRAAQNRKPATYRCPLCGELLPALVEHMLLFPEGDRGRRRHAHTACVMRARAQGRLPSRDEWKRAAQAAEPGPAARQRTLLSKMKRAVARWTAPGEEG